MDPVLTTERLVLREILLSDDAFVHELMNEPPWIQFIGDREIHDRAAARRYIEDTLRPSYAEHGFGFYLVELEDGRTPLGICGLIKRDTLDDVDLGFALLERHWGRGYAREAAEAMISFACRVLGLRRLAAVTDPANERSIRLIEKLGMHFEGTVRLGDRPATVSLYARAL
jgi:RimJ/RimL family protein N-acetyltransferase